MGIKDIFSQAVKELWKKDSAEDNTDAIVFGDINASTIAVTDGAIIQGYVNTTFLSKEDKPQRIPRGYLLRQQDHGKGVKTNRERQYH